MSAQRDLVKQPGIEIFPAIFVSPKEGNPCCKPRYVRTLYCAPGEQGGIFIEGDLYPVELLDCPFCGQESNPETEEFWAWGFTCDACGQDSFLKTNYPWHEELYDGTPMPKEGAVLVCKHCQASFKSQGWNPSDQ